MTSAETELYVLCVAEGMNLPEFDPVCMAQCLINELAVMPTISAESRAVLIGTAAVLIRHSGIIAKAQHAGAEIVARVAESTKRSH